jgi:hypothetical protein
MSFDPTDIKQLEQAYFESKRESARLREALKGLIISGEWLAFGNLPDDDTEPLTISEALNRAHDALCGEVPQ